MVVGAVDGESRTFTDVSRISDGLKRMLVALSSKGELTDTLELDKNIDSIPVTDDCDREVEKREPVVRCISIDCDGLSPR